MADLSIKGCVVAVGMVIFTGALLPAAAQAQGTAALDGSTLRYTAAPSEQNVVAVGQSGATVTLSDSAGLIDGDGPGGCSVSGGTAASCVGVASIEIELGDGEDTLCVTAPADPVCRPRPVSVYPQPEAFYLEKVSRFSYFTQIPITADGGPGDDRLHGGDGGDLLKGGSGNDWLYGHRGGEDRLEAGDGSDRLHPEAFYYDRQSGPQPTDDMGRNVMDGGLGSDVIESSNTYDVVDYSSRAALVRVDLAKYGPRDFKQGEPGEEDALSSMDGILTGSGDDIILPRPGTNFYLTEPAKVEAGAGRDRVQLLYGGGTPFGALTVKGGSGDDRVQVKQHGPYIILGEDGDDRLYGGYRGDLLDGGSGDDKLTARGYGYTVNWLVGGSGENRLTGHVSQDIFVSTADGADTIRAKNGLDSIFAADGDSADSISCGKGADGVPDSAPQYDLPVSDPPASGDTVKPDCLDPY